MALWSKKEVVAPEVVKDILTVQEEKLAGLVAQSASALSVVTSTINNLDTINSEISNTVDTINNYIADFTSMKDELESTSDKNAKIASKFRALIED